MKEYIKWTIRLITVIIIFCLPVLANAQVDPGCDPAIDPTCVPIDGGLSLLIAAGVGYGIKKVRDGRKQQQA